MVLISDKVLCCFIFHFFINSYQNENDQHKLISPYHYLSEEDLVNSINSYLSNSEMCSHMKLFNPHCLHRSNRSEDNVVLVWSKEINLKIVCTSNSDFDCS